MQMVRGIHHFEAHDPAVLPIENNHRIGPLGNLTRDAVSSWHQGLVGQVDVGSIDFGSYETLTDRSLPRTDRAISAVRRLLSNWSRVLAFCVRM